MVVAGGGGMEVGSVLPRLASCMLSLILSIYFRISGLMMLEGWGRLRSPGGMGGSVNPENIDFSSNPATPFSTFFTYLGSGLF